MTVRFGVPLLLAVSLSLAACGRGAPSWTDEGDRLLRNNDLVGAEQAYNRALAEDPHHAPAVYAKGWVLYISGYGDLKETARQLFSRSIDYDPDFYGGYHGKGVILLDENNFGGAERLLRQAWERAPEEPSVVVSMGQLYLRAGQLDAAEQVFEEAARLAPQRGELRRFVADVAIARGRYDVALEEIERGRASSVSGRRGAMLLDEGAVYAHVAKARAAAASDSDGGAGTADALQALEDADTVLARMTEEGFEADAQRLVTEVVGPLRKSFANAPESP